MLSRALRRHYFHRAYSTKDSVLHGEFDRSLRNDLVYDTPWVHSTTRVWRETNIRYSKVLQGTSLCHALLYNSVTLLVAVFQWPHAPSFRLGCWCWHSGSSSEYVILILRLCFFFLLYCLDLGRHFKLFWFVFRIFPCFCFGLLIPCPSLLACYACSPNLDGCILVICCQHRLVLLSKQRCGWRFTADILWWFTFYIVCFKNIFHMNVSQNKHVLLFQLKWFKISIYSICWYNFLFPCVFLYLCPVWGCERHEGNVILFFFWHS